MIGRRRIGAAVEAYRRGKDRVWSQGRMISDPPSERPEPEWSPAPATPRFGVGVASRLDFQRGPDTWRTGPPREARRSPPDTEPSDG